MCKIQLKIYYFGTVSVLLKLKNYKVHGNVEVLVKEWKT